MSNLVKMIRLNNLEYNPNRDPQVYRRPVGELFRIQVWLEGSGSAKGRFEIDGETKCEKSVNLPGKFDCQVSFDEAGTRIGTLAIEANGETVTRSIRLDVDEYAKVG